MTTVAMITHWGMSCGMDDYARDLTAAADGIDFVIFANVEPGASDTGAGRVFRDWDARSDDVSMLLRDLLQLKPDLVHVQFNWSGMTLGALRAIIDCCLESSIPCVVQLHATYDLRPGMSLRPLAPQLKRIFRVIVHGEHDKEHLASWGVSGNVWLWRLGTTVWPRRSGDKLRRELGIGERTPVVATFGFLQPRKGTLETIEAVATLREKYPEVFLIAANALHPRGYDATYYLQCRSRITSLGLEDRTAFITRFLPEETAMVLLQSAHVIVLPYVDTAEGTSAAAKFCAAAGRPLILSAEPIFEAYRASSLTLDSGRAEAIAEAVDLVVSDERLAAQLASLAIEHAESTSWSRLGGEYEAFVRNAAGLPLVSEARGA